MENHYAAISLVILGILGYWLGGTKTWRQNIGSRLAILFIILLGLLMYALTLHGDYGNFYSVEEYNYNRDATSPFESSHERASFAQYLSIINQGRFDLSQELADFSSPDVGYLLGRYYSYFPPGISMAMIPLGLVGEKYNLGQVFGYATIALVSVWSLILIFKIAREVLQLPIWASLFAVIVYGFASTSWGYAVTIFQHAVTTFLMLLIFYAAWRYKQFARDAWAWAAIVWMGYGLSLAFDYPNPVLLLPIMVYFLLSSFRINMAGQRYAFKFNTLILVTFLLYGAIIAPQLYFNKINFGNYLQFSNTLPRYDTNKDTRILQEINTQEVAAKKSKASSIFSEEEVAHGAYLLSVAPEKGILFFSPILLLGLIGIFLRKYSAETITLVGLVIVNFLLYASFGDPWGGWAYGPRYLIPTMAVLALFAGVCVAKTRGQVVGSLGAFLAFAYSSAVALLGALTTNNTPPKVEADFLGAKYGAWFNIDFLMQGKSASFVYKNYLGQQFSLVEYFTVIYGFLILVALVILFLLPRWEKTSGEQ